MIQRALNYFTQRQMKFLDSHLAFEKKIETTKSVCKLCANCVQIKKQAVT